MGIPFNCTHGWISNPFDCNLSPLTIKWAHLLLDTRDHLNESPWTGGWGTSGAVTDG